MLAPTLCLAVPLRTPHPIVCGRFPSSQSPIKGNTIEVSVIISLSLVNMIVYVFLTIKEKTKAVVALTTHEAAREAHNSRKPCLCCTKFVANSSGHTKAY
ncbi:hypothetical protein Lal_00011877 [Lupinus albus]|nr:hypothetical protein Lal_00011877 [Lupinus albus]